MDSPMTTKRSGETELTTVSDRVLKTAESEHATLAEIWEETEPDP